MNWKKVLLFTFTAGFLGPLGHWASEVQAGHSFAFNFGNIVAPALGTIIPTLLALFVKPPNQP